MSALLAGPALQLVSPAGKDTLKGFGHDAWWVVDHQGRADLRDPRAC